MMMTPRKPGRKSQVPDDVVERIRRRREDGASYPEIADELNEDGVPTAQGGSKWWPATVRGVLEGWRQ